MTLRRARVLLATVLQVGVCVGIAGACWVLQRYVAVIDEEAGRAQVR